MSFTQEQVDRIVKAVADAAYEQSARLAQMAVEETGMGVAAHKKLKMKSVHEMCMKALKI